MTESSILSDLPAKSLGGDFFSVGPSSTKDIKIKIISITTHPHRTNYDRLYDRLVTLTNAVDPRTTPYFLIKFSEYDTYRFIITDGLIYWQFMPISKSDDFGYMGTPPDKSGPHGPTIRQAIQDFTNQL